MLLIINTFGFPKTYIRYKKNLADKIVHLKKIYKFTPDFFLIEQIVVVSIVKNVNKNEKFHFASNLCWIRKKF